MSNVVHSLVNKRRLILCCEWVALCIGNIPGSDFLAGNWLS